MTTPAETYRLEEQIGFKLRKVHQQASEVFARVMAGYDVTPTQFAALTKLYDEGAVSQNALGRLTAMDPATMSGVVNRLKNRTKLANVTALSCAMTNRSIGSCKRAATSTSGSGPLVGPETTAESSPLPTESTEFWSTDPVEAIP